MSATRFSFSSFFTFSEGLNIGDHTEPVVITTTREKYRKGVLMTHKKKRDHRLLLKMSVGFSPGVRCRGSRVGCQGPRPDSGQVTGLL